MFTDVESFSTPLPQNEKMNNRTAMALEDPEALPVGEKLRGARPAFVLQDPRSISSSISKTTDWLHKYGRLLTLPSDTQLLEWRQDHLMFLQTGLLHLVKLFCLAAWGAILLLLAGTQGLSLQFTNLWATATIFIVLSTWQIFICVPCWQLYRAVKKGESAAHGWSMLVVCLVLSDQVGSLALFLSMWYQHSNQVHTNIHVVLLLASLLAERCLCSVHRVSLVFVSCGSFVLLDCLSNELNDGVSVLFRLTPVVALASVCLVVMYCDHSLRQELADSQAARGEAQAARDEAQAARDEAQAARDEAQTARGEAEDALKAQTSFLARMSHEIRTPLHGVLGLIGLLSETPLTDEQKTFVNDSLLAGRALTCIVNDILDLGKMRAGKLDLEEIGVQIRLLPQNCINAFRAQIGEKRLTFDVNVDEDIPDVVVGDPVRVLQVLNNLISNAIKFSDHASLVRVSVTMKPFGWFDKSERVSRELCTWIFFQVRDSGIGMSQVQQEKLFSPFYQCKSSITREYGGTGLGLSIVKELVELMGGSIRVHSQLGSGSRFEFAIPFSPSSDTMDQPSGDNRQDVGDLWSRLRVMIVDDTDTNLVILEHKLRGLNVQKVTPFRSGKDCIEACQADPECADLIFMDVHMPGIDGLETTQKLRELGVKIPIVGLTADATPQTKAQGLANGMDAVEMKPFRWPKVCELVAQLVKKGSSSSTQALSAPQEEQQAQHQLLVGGASGSGATSALDLKL